LAEEGKVSPVPAVEPAPAVVSAAEKNGPKYFRIGAKTHPWNLTLVEDKAGSLPSPVPTAPAMRSPNRGSFAAKLWSSPSHFSQQILKRKARTA
jgi:hypothetical protein